jgi:hypothetical protein
MREEMLARRPRKRRSGVPKGWAFAKRIKWAVRRRVLGWRTEELTWLEGVIGLAVALAVGLSWGFIIHEALQ